MRENKVNAQWATGVSQCQNVIRNSEVTMQKKLEEGVLLVFFYVVANVEDKAEDGSSNGNNEPDGICYRAQNRNSCTNETLSQK